jgi:IclR family transcriptional regulator, acetate operon repressor
MHKPPALVKPSYIINSVDHALRLVQMLRDNGQIGLTQGATELGVSPSTVHRMMAMLVYRGFALRDADRRYVPGPAMSVAPVSIPWAQEIKDICRPHLELLASRMEETVNLMIRVGTKVRFLTTVEVQNIIRIGDRSGSVLEAHQASGGKALLAEVDTLTLERLYRSKSAQIAGGWMDDEHFAHFLRELANIRTTGFAMNYEESETGIRALGFTIHDPSGRAVVAVSVAAPTFRSARLFEKDSLALADESRSDIEADIATSGIAARIEP